MSSLRYWNLDSNLYKIIFLALKLGVRELGFPNIKLENN